MISGTTSDPWRISNEEKAKHDQQFFQLNPVNGFVTGAQAKNLFLQSGLPPLVLGQIWSLADMNADGKMDRHEFSIAMHLIQMKLKGAEIPKTLPAVLKNPPAPTMGTFGAAMGLGGMRPPNPSQQGTLSGPRPVITNGSILMGQGFASGSPGSTPPMSTVTTIPNIPPPGVETKIRSSSTTSQDSVGSLTEWAVPHVAKLRYTQLFNTNDRSRTGFLNGNQARAILLQSNLPQPILAKIWALSDIDGDGRLTCEEFCLAMHLTDMSKAGDPLPVALPLELIPPSYRRKRSSSVQSSGGGSSVPIAQHPDLNLENKDENTMFNNNTFEDKRKMNFEKGQAELEKRRQALLESQRKEQEERERKEREEQEKRERIRQEQERRRQMELEKQLAKQRELEQEKEEQRRKAMEQREAARREMERQRQLEWERQRCQDLMSQRMKEQEAAIHLKSRNKNLTYDLDKMTNKMNELNNKITETRNGVTQTKSEIDNMKEERDKKVTLINCLKLQLKEQNDKMLFLNQEKANLENKVKAEAEVNPNIDSLNIVMHSFKNKQITLNQLREMLSNIEKTTAQKLHDIDDNNKQLKSVTLELSQLIEKTNNLRKDLEKKRQEATTVKMVKAEEPTKTITEKPEEPTKTITEKPEDPWASQNAFPSSDSFNSETEVQHNNSDDLFSNTDLFKSQPADDKKKETFLANDDLFANGTTLSSPPAAERSPPECKMVKYRALYAFESRNEDELSIMPGDIVMVPLQQNAEPGWLGGELKGKTGWFPAAYVECVDNTSKTNESATNSDGLTSPASGTEETVHIVGTEMKMTLTGISEAPEGNGDSGSICEAPVVTEDLSNDIIQHSEKSSFINVSKSAGGLINDSASPVPGQGQEVEGLQAQALFPWRAKKENHLTFNKGDVINVKEQQDMWWYGECEDKVGWFPKSYVKLIAGPKRPNSVSMSVTDAAPDPINESPTKETTGTYYISMYSYQSEEPGDLPFNQGDVILVTKAEGDWWTGSIGADKTGIFPSNYVQKVDSQDSKDLMKQVKPADSPKQKGSKLRKPEIATVIAPYTATGSGQISLQRGQLIQVRKRSPSGWWEGELQAKGKQRQIGWFPASYVKLLTSSGSTPNTSERNTPDITAAHRDEMNITPSAREQVTVSFSYTAQNSDEVSLVKGEIVTVISKDDRAWWKGENSQGIVGLFPANYVQSMVEADQSPSSNQ